MSESSNVTTDFEHAFGEAERSAATAARAGALIVSAAKQMQKAAQEGDIGKLRKAVERLVTASESARQDIANARTAWRFTEDSEREYLESHYEQELLAAAGAAGLKIQSRDGRLLAFPSIIRIVPSELAVRIDRKRTTGIRPSWLTKQLLANQARRQRFSSQNFLESLHAAYRLVSVSHGPGAVIKLSRVYQTLTLLPGLGSEYGKGEFARDLFNLDQSGVETTRGGARVSFPASSGTRAAATDLFTIVSPTGEVHTYYGLRFTEG